MIRKLLACAAIVLAAAPAMAADPIANAADIVKAADWKQMQSVEVVIAEHSYTPETITLQAGKPYKIVLKNTGTKPHYFTAPDFFKGIATRKAQTKEAEFKAPYFNAIEINENGVAELFFVPATKGSFDVYCTIEDHREKGMEGKIVVE
ncbi:MAG: cupredoxin domain-containing protein [Magnetospirillum sp.]|nr:cupredoxin domain-containing protein [Magnetospirillum sp.]